MAAVAGSKGRLELLPRLEASLQIDLMAGLLAGRFSAIEAAGRLIEAGRIREVGIDTNMICNLSCAYCYLNDRPEAKGTVPLDELQKRLTWLAQSGAKLFAFIGKEPLSDGRAPDLLVRLDAMRRAGGRFRTGLVTNGTLVERWIDQLAAADVSYIDISVDGLSDHENRLRGTGVTERIRRGIDAVVRSPLRSRFATATVLTGASVGDYPRFVAEMLDAGVPTCFASPVLRFAMSNDVADYAVSLDSTLHLADRLAEVADSGDPDVQVILDLPYRYTWALLASGHVPLCEVREDAYEALYWRLSGSNVFLKLNPFSYSYWRALRITHDGKVILNMDLAAHADYAVSARPLSDVGPSLPPLLRETGGRFLKDFIGRHLAGGPAPLFERGLADQFAHDSVQLGAA